MKKIWLTYKWLWLILINALPFALNVLFYKNGGMDDVFLFLPIFAGLTYLNYRNCNTAQFIGFQAWILLGVIVSGYASTYLYYHNVSNDSMTPPVGQLVVMLEAAAVIVASAIAAIIKTRKVKSKAAHSSTE